MPAPALKALPHQDFLGPARPSERSSLLLVPERCLPGQQASVALGFLSLVQAHSGLLNLSLTATSRSSWARRRAMAWPIPRAAPVTRVTLVVVRAMARVGSVGLMRAKA